MNKLILFTLSILLIVSSGIAQNGQQKDKIEAYRVAFITKELDLTTDEAQKFWPVYIRYSEELRALHRDRRSQWKEADRIDDMSDREVERKFQTQMDLEQRELDLRKRYHQEFKKVLPVKKVAKLYHAERLFKRELIEKLKERRRN